MIETFDKACFDLTVTDTETGFLIFDDNDLLRRLF